MTSQSDIIKYLQSSLRETPRMASDYIVSDGKFLPKRNCFIKVQKFVKDFLNREEESSEYLERWLVLPGLRGTGKTTLLFQIFDYLRKRGVHAQNILYLPMDDVKNFLGVGVREAISHYIENIKRTTLVELEEKIFIFIDEAHFDENWDQTVKVLHDKTQGNQNLFVIVTGSSSISLEMSTDSVRRKKKLSILPLNFQEYLKLKFKFFPPKGTAGSIRKMIFEGDAESLGKVIGNEYDLQRRFLELPKSDDTLLEDFVYYGGFPFAINMKPYMAFEKVAELVDKIIFDDLPIVYSFNTKSRPDILKILMFLALKKPGELSQQKLSRNIGIPLARVNQTLEALEKTHLIFSVKPHQGAAGTIRDAWRYYFVSPTIKASLLFKYGRLDMSDRTMFGELIEHTVASSFFKMMKTIGHPNGIFFDSQKGGADFLLTMGDKLIPVEVGLGDKTKKQTAQTSQRYKNIDHRLIISNTEETQIDNKTIYLPLKTFLFS